MYGLTDGIIAAESENRILKAALKKIMKIAKKGGDPAQKVFDIYILASEATNKAETITKDGE